MNLPKEFIGPAPRDYSDIEVLDHVQRCGCHIWGVRAEEDAPSYFFSVGLFANYSHPEILVFSTGTNAGAHWINAIGERASRGIQYSAGDILTDLVEGKSLHFADVPVELYPDYLGYAMWFYGSLAEPFPCLQLVWPDAAGKLPWQIGCDEEVKAEQPVLAIQHGGRLHS